MSAYNYTLLVEGQVKAQKPLSTREFRKFIRRSGAAEDYFERVVMDLVHKATIHSNNFKDAEIRRMIRKEEVIGSHCCDVVLSASDVSTIFYCKSCKWWKVSSHDIKNRVVKKRKLNTML